MGKLSDRISGIRYAYEDLKPNVTITVFGSYEPEKYRKRLTDLVSDLKAAGWDDCDTAKGRHPIASARDASVQSIHESDVLLFVLVPGGSPQGINVELFYILEKYREGNLGIVRKVWLLEDEPIGNEHGLLGEIVGGQTTVADFSRRTFDRDDREELFRQAEGCLVEYVHRGAQPHR